MGASAHRLCSKTDQRGPGSRTSVCTLEETRQRGSLPLPAWKAKKYTRRKQLSEAGTPCRTAFTGAPRPQHEHRARLAKAVEPSEVQCRKPFMLSGSH